MKKKIFILPLITSILMTSCSSNTKDKNTMVSNNYTSIVEKVSSITSSSTIITTEDNTELNKYILLAIAKLDELVNPVIDKITDEDLKSAILKYYNDEKKAIESIKDLNTAKEATTKVVNDTKSFAKNTLKPLIGKKLDEYFIPLIDKLPDETLKSSVQSFYNQEALKINNVESLDQAINLHKEIFEDVKTFINDETERILILLKDEAIEKLDEYVVELINKIAYEKLKNDTQVFYQTEKIKIQNASTIEELKELVDSLKSDLSNYVVTESIKIVIDELDKYVVALVDKIPNETLKNNTKSLYVEEKKKVEKCKTIDELNSTVQEIKDDLVTFALDETKKLAKEQLDNLVESGLTKLPNEKVRKELRDFYDVEILKLMAVNNLEEVEPTLSTVLEETKVFIKELTISIAKEYLTELFKYKVADPYQYVPEAMRPNYANNLVTSPIMDFTSSVVISNMNRQGYGEQWQMVVENLNQVLVFTKAMNVVDELMTTIANAMNIYIENTTTDELAHTINNDNYVAILTFKDGIFNLEVNFKKQYSVVGIGSISPKIKLSLDIFKFEKVIYISLNESNVIKYTMCDDLFELALTYGLVVGGKQLSRTSFFETNKDSNGIRSGHIYEHTSFEGEDKIKACADFYVKDGYVSVVGNKASGMVGFSGFINELYSANEGRLLGYKVQEELEIMGVKGTYHTLWFNLWNIQGLNNVKVNEKTNANKSGRSTVDVYLNNSTSLLSPTYNSKIVKTSRKYDIELRNRYYYDVVDGNLVCQNVQVPMMFIQDDNNIDTNYSDFARDFKKDNGIDVSVNISSSVLKMIRDDYDTLIPIFKENKDKMSSKLIIEYLNK